MFPDDTQLGTASKDVNTIIEILNDHSEYFRLDDCQ